MTEFAVDISNWSGVPSPEQARQIRAAGFARAICGTQHAATTQGQLDVLGAAGLALEAYTYLRFDRDPAPQLEAGLAALGGRVVERMWLDCEAEAALERLGVAGVIEHIVQAAEACVGVVFSGIYTRRGWWLEQTGNSTRFRDFPLWDATNDGRPDLAFSAYGGWERVTMEQFAFDQPVAGVNCDLNIVAPPLVLSAADPVIEARAALDDARRALDTIDAVLPRS